MPGDPWANTEFHIKWKRYAYIQCSWDTKATLSQLGGYKRVINYMKRWDDLQVRRSADCETEDTDGFTLSVRDLCLNGFA